MMFLTLMGVSGMMANGCAHTPGAKPGTEAPSNDPKQTLLKKLGIVSDGAQPDGSEVQFGEGMTEDEAIENAKALVSMLLEGDLNYTIFTLEQSGKWTACVRGKPVMTAEELTEKLLKEAGVEGMGEQPGGVEVQQGEGSTATGAIKNTIAIIQMLHDDQKEWDFHVKSAQLTDGTWIAVVIARPSARVFAENMLAKHFSEAKDFGDQPDGSRVSWGSGKDKKEAEENAKTMSFLMGEEEDVFSFSSRSEQMPDSRWIVVIKGEKGENVEQEFEPPKDPDIMDDMLAMTKEISESSKQVEQMGDEMIDDVRELATDLPDLAEMEIEEQQLLQGEEALVKKYIGFIKRANPLGRVNSPENQKRLAKMLVEKQYIQGTDVIFDFWELKNDHAIAVTLNGKRQEPGKGKNWQEAYENCLKNAETNELDGQRAVKMDAAIRTANKVRLPKTIKNRGIVRLWLARTLLDKGFPEGTDVDIEIDSYEDHERGFMASEAYVTTNGKRYEKGAGLVENFAFHDALGQVKPNDLSPEGVSRYHEMLKKLKKFRMPKELQKPIYKKWLARILIDTNKEFDPEMTIDIEEKTNEETKAKRYKISLNIPGIIDAHAANRTIHGAFAEIRIALGDESSIFETSQPETKPLTVNTNGSHETITRSRQAGEADLMELANEQGLADLWLYMRHYNGEERFHECGEDETREKTDFNIMALEKVTPENKIGQLTLYKQHPIDPTGTLDKSQMLSRQDLMNFLFVLEMVKDKNYQLADRMDFRVAVSSGIHRIKFHPQILKNKKLMILAVHKISQLHEVWLRPYDEDFDYEQRRRSEFAKTNAAFAKKFSSRLMEITFEPAGK